MTPSNFEQFIISTNVRELKIENRILKLLFSIGEMIFPSAVADFVRGKFFSPNVKPLSASQKRWLKKARSRDINFNGNVLKCWSIGSGPAILFAHGWNGRGIQFHQFFQQFLDAGYSVIFYDAPAHGDSDGEMTNYLEITESLEEIFKYDFGYPIIGMVAHSMGASVTINYLSTQPNNLPLVFVAPALKLMELLFQSFQLHGIPKKTYLKLIGEVEQRYQIRLETRNPIDLISQLTNNILIIHDSGDHVTPIDASRVVSAKNKNIDLHTTEGLGHNRLLKNTRVVERAVSFIQENSHDLARQIDHEKVVA